MQPVRFTAEQIAKFRETFHLFDPEGEGVVSVTELQYLIRVLGFQLNEAHIEKILQKADFNKTGKLDFSSVLDIIAENFDNKIDTDDDLDAAFKIFDKDGDGYISHSELRLIMNTLGEKLTDEELDEMMKIADVNSDGKISYGEFLLMMSKP